jgi:hypothetical protein
MLNNTNLNRFQLAEIVSRQIPGLNEVIASSHLQACLICLDHNKHTSGVELLFKMDTDNLVILEWDETVDDHMKRVWGDLQEATESGATCIAILLVTSFTEYTVIERSAKGTGFDYWLLEEELWDEDEIFPEGSARLEVSGMIKEEKDSKIRSRVNQKKKQTEVSDHMNLPAIVVVVEFSRPIAILAKRQ